MKKSKWYFLAGYVAGSFVGLPMILGMVKGRSAGG